MVWGGLRWFAVVCGNSMAPIQRLKIDVAIFSVLVAI